MLRQRKWNHHMPLESNSRSEFLKSVGFAVAGTAALPLLGATMRPAMPRGILRRAPALAIHPERLKLERLRAHTVVPADAKLTEAMTRAQCNGILERGKLTLRANIPAAHHARVTAMLIRPGGGCDPSSDPNCGGGGGGASPDVIQVAYSNNNIGDESFGSWSDPSFDYAANYSSPFMYTGWGTYGSYYRSAVFFPHLPIPPIAHPYCVTGGALTIAASAGQLFQAIQANPSIFGTSYTNVYGITGRFAAGAIPALVFLTEIVAAVSTSELLAIAFLAGLTVGALYVLVGCFVDGG